MAEVSVTDDEVAAGAAESDEEFEYQAPEGTRPEAEDGEGESEAPNGNGRKTLADLAAEAPEAEEGDEGDEEPQTRLFGSDTKVTSAVKGKRPETSAIKFKAGQIAVTGQFHFDDVVELRVLAQLDEVKFVAVRDKDRKIKAVKRVHNASAITVEQINLPAEVQRARLEHAAEALGVEADALAGALERAAAEVGAE